VNNVKCENGNDGSIDITVLGGAQPFEFYWSTGATTEDITSLPEGVYVVNITDANGCTHSATYSIIEESHLLISVGVTNANCAANNGSATVSVSGGIQPYQYNWSNGGSTAFISGLAVGTYSVTVTDGNNCTATQTVTVNNVSNLNITAIVTDAICANSNGSIDITVTGGSGSYTYAWSNQATTEDLAGLSAGVYTVTVTDGVCSGNYTVTVLDIPAISLNINTTNSDCGQSNGSISVAAFGGTGNYTYQWSTGATGAGINDIPAGAYSVTVTDANGCTVEKLISIDDNNVHAIDATLTHATCGNNDGSITLSITGGQGPFTYQWSHGATTRDIFDLAPGIYVVTVYDANGCAATGIYTINTSTEIYINANRYDALCFGDANGSISVTATGGSGSYSFEWSNTATTQSITGLAAGTYQVTATDINGCSATTIVLIEQPDLLVASIQTSVYAGGNGVSCSGAQDGNLDLTVQGGTFPYDYLWNTNATTQDLSGVGAGTYSVTVTDANGCTTEATAEITEPNPLNNTLTAGTYSGGYNVSCNGARDGSITAATTGGTEPYSYEWSTGETTSAINEVGAGTYSVTVTDANGCTAVSTITLNQPETLTATAQATEPTCGDSDNGSIDLTVTGGTPNYTYQWSNGNTTEDITQLPSGTYSVIVTDANGCTAEAGATITIISPLDLSGTVIINESCIDFNDGYLEAKVTGGTEPYQYQWSTGATTTSISNLGDGTYTLTVTDAKGCSTTASFTIGGPSCNNPPVAVNDTTTTSGGTSIDIPVMDNDWDPDDDNIFVSVVSDPQHGTATINSDGTITYTPDEGFVGIDSFTYVICDDGIPQMCDTATVYITVMPGRPNVFIPNGFSPNGDAYNQYWEIIDITEFPKNEVIIFNRWGNKVYEVKPYQNEWEGQNMKGEDLPDGTYYYILKLNDDNGTVYTGFVVINRGN
jgi:gliding motility-associated-like protein